MGSIFPLTGVEVRLREDLGTHGDSGNNSVHDKLDNVKTDTNSILTNVAGLPTDISNLSSQISDVDADIVVVDGVVDSILSEVTNATYGLSALQPVISTISTNVDAANSSLSTLSTDVQGVQSSVTAAQTDITEVLSRIGDPGTSSITYDISELSGKLDQIQNNTRTTIALLSEMELPDSGVTTDYLIQLNNFDVSGNMKNADSPPTVSVQNFAGVDRTGNLVDESGAPTSTMSIDVSSTGRYSIRYRVTDSHALEGLAFTFTIVEDGVSRSMDRVSRVVDMVSSTFTTRHRLHLEDVLADTENMQPKLGTPVTDISTDIAAIKGVVDDVKLETASILGDTPDIQSRVIAMQGATFDSSTDSLEAISDNIEALTTAASSQRIFRASQTILNLAAGSAETAVMAVSSPYNVIKELRVIPTTQTSNNFTVEICEKSDGSRPLMRFERADASKGDLKLSLDLVFVNQDTTISPNIYVKVANVTDSSQSTFDIEVRGVVANI